MNELTEELNLLRVLAGACAQARKLGTAATARVALRYEERYQREIEKVAVKMEEARQAAEVAAA